MRGIITDSSVPGGLRLAEDLPEPEPGPCELLPGVRAYSLNAGELSLVRQRADGWRPGQDVAGVVLRAAADGSGPSEGARVVAYPEQHGWAERISVPAGWVATLPAAVSFEQAAALPVAGITALRALRLGGSVLGRNVLVTGATGGVGQIAVQLAAASGARVTALVTGPGRAADARALGAHQVVTSLDSSGLGPFHLVLDGVGGPIPRQVAGLLAPEATIALYGGRAGPLLAGAAAAVLGGWFTVTAVIAGHGWYDTHLGQLLWQPTAMAGSLGILLALSRVPVVARALAAPGTASRLVLPHAFRVTGVFFLLYLALGHLPALFAVPAGVGDIAAGLAAALVARGLARGTGRRAAVWFSVYGLIDLTVGITLGALTQPGMLNVTPSSVPISELPLALVIAADVPLMIALHITCLITLARTSRPAPTAVGASALAGRRR